jgi:hypothetical protein
MRGQLAAHDLFWNFPNVIEQAIANRDLGDFLEVKRLALALQDLDGGLGKSHLNIPSVGALARAMSCIRKTLRPRQLCKFGAVELL